MALGTFPNRIKVTLGSRWDGTGNGLVLKGVNPEDSDNTLILKKNDGSSWYEDAGDTGSVVGNASTNRIKWTPTENNGGMAKIIGLTTGSSFAGGGPQVQVQGGGGVEPDYDFKEMWNMGANATPTGSVSPAPSITLIILTSFLGASFNSVGWAGYTSGNPGQALT